jgi:type II secretory pathway component PulK
MNAKRLRNRRGFATLYAIALLGLVAVALTLLTKQVGYEIRRTKLASDDAQLRQLLLAGARSTLEHASRWGDAPTSESWQLDLPSSLAEKEDSLTIVCTPGESGEVNGEITARVDRRTALQTLRLKRSAQNWTVSEAHWGM